MIWIRIYLKKKKKSKKKKKKGKERKETDLRPKINWKFDFPVSKFERENVETESQKDNGIKWKKSQD